MAKQDAINLVAALPDKLSQDDPEYFMYVHQKIEQGKSAAPKGDVYTSAEARHLLKNNS